MGNVLAAPAASRGIAVKRAYEEPRLADGYRVLVDRLWPRGVRRDRAALDEWARGLAPSDGLRRWFGHDPSRWAEFRRRYLDELASPEARTDLGRLARRAVDETLTLVYAARDEEHNGALVLAEAIAGFSVPPTNTPQGRAPAVDPPRQLIDAIERMIVGGVSVTTLALAGTGTGIDLTLPQWRALVIVTEEEGLRVGEIAGRVGATNPSTSRLLRRLESRGLVTVGPAEGDRRASSVRSTPTGRRLKEAVVDERRRLIGRALGDGHLELSSAAPDDLGVLAAALARASFAARS